MEKKKEAPVILWRRWRNSAFRAVKTRLYRNCRAACAKKLSIFGESHIDEIAAEIGVPVLGKMPIHPEFAELVDEGRFAEVDNTDIAKINI